MTYQNLHVSNQAIQDACADLIINSKEILFSFFLQLAVGFAPGKQIKKNSKEKFFFDFSLDDPTFELSRCPQKIPK